MVLAVDAILDRIKLKAQVQRWRFVALAALAIIALIVAQPMSGSGKHSLPLDGLKELKGTIGRVNIEGIITENDHWLEVLDGVAEDKSVKALIVSINSPGGTIVGSETLFDALAHIRKKKPVVVIMGDYAASGGYWIALAGDRIWAHNGTITGSIGVVMQTADVTGLAEKLGVGLHSFKSSELKGAPSPFEKLTPRVQAAIEDTIRDTYELFVEHVMVNRKFSREQVNTLADGRVYTGRQAVKANLIDAIGGQREAVAWLEKEKKIPAGLEVKEILLDEKESAFDSLFSTMIRRWDIGASSFKPGIWAVMP